MADNSVISRSGLAGLFGMPGVDFRQQQEEKEAFARASLTPMQQLSARAIGQGKAAGRELAGLFGAEDPVMKEQSVSRQARAEIQQKGLQPNTPEFWDALTVRLGELNAPNAQAEASNIGLQIKEKTQKIATDRATEIAKGKEQVKQVGLTTDGRQVYQSGASQFVLTAQGPQPYYGKLESRQNKTEINGLDKIFDKAFTTQEAKDQAEVWTKAGDAYRDAAKVGRTVRDMESVIGSAFVGPYGTLQAGLSRAFGGGKRLSDTEVFDALSSQLVTPLAKTLPGSLAVKELEQLIKQKPNISQSEPTIRKLLNQISQDIKASEITYEAGENYRNKNGGKISGFNPNIANNKATKLVELREKFKQKGELSKAEREEAKKLAEELNVKDL